MVTGASCKGEEATALLSLKEIELDPHSSLLTPFSLHLPLPGEGTPPPTPPVPVKPEKVSAVSAALDTQRGFLKDHVWRSTAKQLILCTYGSKRLSAADLSLNSPSG